MLELVAELFNTWPKGKLMRIYSLFDRKLREFGDLLLMNNDESCKRALRDALAQPPRGGQVSQLQKWPEDYDLKLLGVFDVERGKIQPEEIPVLVCNVAELAPPQILISGGEDAEG